MALPVLGLLGAAAPPALKLATELAPGLVRWIAGDDSKAAKAAETAAGVAKALTGEDEEARAVAALKADPSLLLQFTQAANDFAVRMRELDVEQLRTVNETFRKEVTSGDAFVRRWRPTFGYIVSLTWSIQFAAIAYAMVATPEYAKELVEAVVALTPMWGIALAVLGVNVVKRSQDKEVAAGFQPQPGLIQKVFGGAKGAAS